MTSISRTVYCGIQKLLEQLNPHKAADPGGIKATILKELAKEIAPILTIIFKISYDTATIPEQWKTAIFQHVYKKAVNISLFLVSLCQG